MTGEMRSIVGHDHGRGSVGVLDPENDTQTVQGSDTDIDRRL